MHRSKKPEQIVTISLRIADLSLLLCSRKSIGTSCIPSHGGRRDGAWPPRDAAKCWSSGHRLTTHQSLGPGWPTNLIQTTANASWASTLPGRPAIPVVWPWCNGLLRVGDVCPWPPVTTPFWRWLRANGYKKEATSCKLQAASLTRKNYNVIGESRRKKLCKQKKL